MKPTTTTVQTVSTVASGAQVMGIDAAGMGTVLSILSNMYSDGSLAVVREYSSNALDAHVEAGNSEPVLITTPSYLNPTFTVQDFGTGLSRDEVLGVFAQYGASTKRGSDDQIGSFGIGAKSAFTVGTQFAVTAVKDGMETIALFALNDNGAPTVNIIGYGATLEPNGVKVEVGVKDVQGITRAIDRLFPTWKRGTVLVDGVEPASVWDDLDALDDQVHLGWREDRYHGDAWTIVMGGIPYVLPAAVIDSLGHRQRMMAQNVKSSYAKVYLTVPIGAVDITPSREELRVTAKTTAAIEVLIERFSQLLPSWISDQIESAESIITAMMEATKLKGRLGSIDSGIMNHVRWHGQPLPTTLVQFPDVEGYQLRNKRGNYYGEKVASRDKGMVFGSGAPMDKYLFVTGVPEKRVRSVQLAARAYLTVHKEVGRVIALTLPDASYTEDWFTLSDPALVKTDFDSFTKEWKPVPTQAQRTATQYQIADGGGTATAADLLPMGTIYYMTNSARDRISTHNPLLKEAIGDDLLIFLKPTQKPEALERRVPKAVDARVAMGQLATKLLASLTQDDIDTITSGTFRASVNDTTLNFLEARRTEITNPTVLKVLAQNRRAASLQNNSTDRMRLLRAAANFLGRALESGEKTSLDLVDWNKMVGGLPLLSVYFSSSNYSRSTRGDDHIIAYVNSITL